MSTVEDFLQFPYNRRLLQALMKMPASFTPRMLAQELSPSRLGSGRVIPRLKWLEKQGWVYSWFPEGNIHPRPRMYELTAKGRENIEKISET